MGHKGSKDRFSGVGACIFGNASRGVMPEPGL